MRQVVLDTETTGLDVADGHRIIEIGCVELSNRRLTGERYHQYIRPDREIEPGAIEVHGISNEFLADKPEFAEIADTLIAFLRDSELIIHNAPFDVGFLNRELERAGTGIRKIEEVCTILDTLELARHKHPGQRNTLDALCNRYQIDNSSRTLHGALLDAELLALTYLAMTGGQGNLFQDQGSSNRTGGQESTVQRIDPQRARLSVVRASTSERAAHRQFLEEIRAACGSSLWEELQLDGSKIPDEAG